MITLDGNLTLVRSIFGSNDQLVLERILLPDRFPLKLAGHNIQHSTQPTQNVLAPAMSGRELQRVVFQYSSRSFQVTLGYLLDKIVEYLESIGAYKVWLEFDQYVEKLKRTVLDFFDDVGHSATQMDIDQMKKWFQ